MNKTAQVLGFLLGTVILFFVFNAALMMWQLTPIVAASKYQHVKTLRWHQQRLVEHFPEEIPPNARGARFYYRAGFLQGGSTIELRVQMPAEFVEQVWATYRPKAKSVFNGAEELDRGAGNPDMLPKWSFVTFPPDRGQTSGVPTILPEDFEILLLSSHPYKSNPVSWNHGESSGISISLKRREVIYWAEDW